MVLLALAGVAPAEIGGDYELSAARLSALFAALGQPDQQPEIAAFLAARGTTASEVIATTLASLDLEATLRAGGLTEEDLAALRERMLEPASAA